jgi:hypothetical protein
MRMEEGISLGGFIVLWGMVGWVYGASRQVGGLVVTYTWDLIRLRRAFLLHSMGFWEGEARTVEIGGVFAPVGRSVGG